MRSSVLHAKDGLFGHQIDLEALADSTLLEGMEEKAYPYLELEMHSEVAFGFSGISIHASRQGLEETVEADTVSGRIVVEDTALEKIGSVEENILVESIALVGIAVEAVEGILVEGNLEKNILVGEKVVADILVENVEGIVEDILMEDTAEVDIVEVDIVEVDTAVNGVAEEKNAVQEVDDLVFGQETMPCLDSKNSLPLALAVISLVEAHQ